MNPLLIIDSIYNDNPDLRQLLLTHSENVARKAFRVIAEAGIAADNRFIFEAAMLHDIGIIKTDAPDIFCHGDLPYIRHGIAGGEMLRQRGLPMHALVCERHTGAGLSADDIIAQNLPLPRHDFLPVSIEEKVICYADKFFSKSGDPEKEKPIDNIINSMKRHGDDTLQRFLELHHLFNP